MTCSEVMKYEGGLWFRDDFRVVVMTRGMVPPGLDVDLASEIERPGTFHSLLSGDVRSGWSYVVYNWLHDDA